MSSQAGRGLRPGGVVRALLRLVVLVIFGFGAGLLFGIVSEEPELLAGHLRGESESVVLTAGNLGAVETRVDSGDGDIHHVLPSVAAPVSTTRPMMPATESARNEKAPGRSASPSVPGGSPPDRSGAWAIQVGAFSEEGAALRLAESLRAKGYPAELLSAQGDAGRWRVRVQPMSGETAAREAAAKLKRVEGLPTWVLRMGTS